jgi:hypothetical protein
MYLPTVTKFGMAALLPNKELTAELKSNGEIGVLADGTSTDASYRDAILKKKIPKAWLCVQGHHQDEARGAKCFG